MTHPNLIVNIQGINYFVDLGIMSSFGGPFALDSQQSFKKQLGNQTYHFFAGEDRKSSVLKVWRGGKMIRELNNSGPAPTPKQLAEGVFATFEKSEMFMTNVVAHKVFGDFSLGIWNRSFYRDQGSRHEVTDLRTFGDLKNAFNCLEMPKVQLNVALEALQANGIQLF